MKAKPELTHARLCELLHYDPLSGVFRALVARGPLKRGAVVGTRRPDGYFSVMVDGRQVLRHRLAWLYMTGGFPAEQVDHVNRVRGDDRWSNLRLADNSANGANRVVAGVYPRGRRFRVEVRGRHLGSFGSAEAARAFYEKAHAAEYGEFSPYYDPSADGVP